MLKSINTGTGHTKISKIIIITNIKTINTCTDHTKISKIIIKLY